MRRSATLLNFLPAFTAVLALSLAQAQAQSTGLEDLVDARPARQRESLAVTTNAPIRQRNGAIVQGWFDTDGRTTFFNCWFDADGRFLSVL